VSIVVHPFTPSELHAALSSKKCSPRRVSEHPQAKYLFRYLQELGAQCIVVEPDYTDGDYLDDYANYYAKSHERYDRTCVRLHFFSEPWTPESLQSALRASVTPEELQRAYLGFAVARPLPEAIIGRTVLAKYPDVKPGGRRFYPATREYTAHLFGTTLTVDSLAFQEQDTVLAACATVALWSAFQKTSELFHTGMPTPVEITRSGTDGLLTTRAFPSRGLAVPQMALAVREVGLEPEVFECNGEVPLLSLLVGYVGLGIPPILGVDIEEQGLHAVAVVGYSLRETRQHTHEDAIPYQLRRVGLRVDELYVHDDGHCPFARIRAHAKRTTPDGPSAIYFDGTWSKAAGAGGDAKLTPVFVMVPVYHKVRLSFIDLQQWISRFTQAATTVLPTTPEPEWITSLTDTNQMKKQVKASGLDSAVIDRVLLSAQPRFIWSARMEVGERPVVEILFDATGMRRSQVAFDVLWYEPAFKALFAKVLERPTVAGKIEEPMLQFLKEHANR
jgi:hypothetical protein